MSRYILKRPSQAILPTTYKSDYGKAEIPSTSSSSNNSTSSKDGSSVREYLPQDLGQTENSEPNSSIFRLIFTIFPNAIVQLYRSMVAKYRQHVAQKKEIRTREKMRLQTLYTNLRTEPPSIEEYPPGWAQLAAFQYSEENFSVFRRFGLFRCRILLQLEAEIQQLESGLTRLDWDDAPPDAPDHYRAHQLDFAEQGRDPTQRDLRRKAEKKFLVYDQLLLNQRALHEVECASRKDHLSVYNWIHRKRPLAAGEYDFIYQPADEYVSLSKIDHFESSIFSSCLKRLFRKRTPNQDTIVDHYSSKDIATFAKLLNVLIAATVLAVPVFILLWIPETKAWICATVLISLISFSTLVTYLTRARGLEILIATIAYCAVLATFLVNMQGGKSLK